MPKVYVAWLDTRTQLTTEYTSVTEQKKKGGSNKLLMNSTFDQGRACPKTAGVTLPDLAVSV